MLYHTILQDNKNKGEILKDDLTLGITVICFVEL